MGTEHWNGRGRKVKAWIEASNPMNRISGPSWVSSAIVVVIIIIVVVVVASLCWLVAVA